MVVTVASPTKPPPGPARRHRQRRHTGSVVFTQDGAQHRTAGSVTRHLEPACYRSSGARQAADYLSGPTYLSDENAAKLRDALGVPWPPTSARATTPPAPVITQPARPNAPHPVARATRTELHTDEADGEQIRASR